MEGWKHQCVVASHVSPTGNLLATQACALTENQIGNHLIHRLTFNPLNRTSQGWLFYLIESGVLKSPTIIVHVYWSLKFCQCFIYFEA